jgi:iron complex transport system ATP-binding protein
LRSRRRCCSSTSALDIGHQQDLLELIDDLRRRLGLTVVSTMHDLTLTAQFADHVILMNRGQVAISGPPVQVLTSAQLSSHYRARVDVIRHNGNLVVVPWRDHNHHQEEST